jgi:hypothetical protein
MLGTGGLSSQTLKLLNTLESKLPDFYLAEGTALAMYYEHRVSYDLDFFTKCNLIILGSSLSSK